MDPLFESHVISVPDLALCATDEDHMTLRSILVGDHPPTPTDSWWIAKEILSIVQSLHESGMCFSKLDAFSIKILKWNGKSAVSHVVVSYYIHVMPHSHGYMNIDYLMIMAWDGYCK